MPALTRLPWGWFAVRVLGLILLGLVSFTFLSNSVPELLLDPRADFAVLSCIGVFFAVLFALGARQAWRVLLGTKIISAHAAETEGATVAAGAICLLMLAAVAPGFKDLVRKSAEGANKGQLAFLRQGIIDYQAAHDGRPPQGLDELESLRGRREFPPLWGYKAGTNHRPTTRWNLVTSTAPSDSGRFAYFIGVSSAGAPEPVLFIDCTHTDSKGTVWTAY